MKYNDKVKISITGEERSKNEIVYNGSLKSNMEIGTYVRKRTLDRNLKTLQNVLDYEQMKMEEE